MALPVDWRLAIVTTLALLCTLFNIHSEELVLLPVAMAVALSPIWLALIRRTQPLRQSVCIVLAGGATAAVTCVLVWVRFTVAQFILQGTEASTVPRSYSLSPQTLIAFLGSAHGVAWVMETAAVLIACLWSKPYATRLSSWALRLSARVRRAVQNMSASVRWTVRVALGMLALLLLEIVGQSVHRRTVVLPFEVSAEAKDLGYTPENVARAIASDLVQIKAGTTCANELDLTNCIWNQTGEFDFHTPAEQGNLGLSLGAVSVSGSVPWFLSLLTIHPREVRGILETEKGVARVYVTVDGKPIHDGVPVTGSVNDLEPILARVTHITLPSLMDSKKAAERPSALADAALWEAAIEAHGATAQVWKDDARLTGALPREIALQQAHALHRAGSDAEALQAYRQTTPTLLNKESRFVADYLSLVFESKGVAELHKAWHELDSARRTSADSVHAVALAGIVLSLAGEVADVRDILGRLKSYSADLWMTGPLAILLVSTGDEARGRRVMEEGIERDSSCSRSPTCNADAHVYWGQFLLRVDHYDAAELVFQDVLKKFPDNADALVGLAVCLENQGRYDDALGALGRASANATDRREAVAALCDTYRAMLRYREAEQVCAEAARIDPLEPARWTALGWLALGRGNHDAALEMARRADWVRSGDVGATRLRAQVHGDRREWDQAIAVLEAAISRRPSVMGLSLDLAQAFLAQRRYVEANRALDEAEARLPTYEALTDQVRGDIFFEQGDLQNALSFYYSAIDHDKRDTSAMNGVAKVLLLGRDMDAATGMLAQALKIDPYSPDVHSRWARAQLDRLEELRSSPPSRVQDPDDARRAQEVLADEARRHLHTALALDERSTEAWRQLARAEVLSGSPEQALRTLDEAEKIVPSDVWLSIGKAETLNVLGRSAEATKTLSTALVNFPGEPELALALGKLWQSTGKFGWAAECFALGQRLDPEGRHGTRAAELLAALPRSAKASAHSLDQSASSCRR